MQARPTFAALVLLGAALDSSALTLGRPQGGAWIGKPLDLVVPLQLDNVEPGGNLCLEAEVTQGDIRVDEKRITLSLDPGSSPDTPRVRLRTTRAIEEPVVQVRLSAGCATKSTRQFTLLADLPPAAPVLPSAPVGSAVAQATGAQGGSQIAGDASGAAPGRMPEGGAPAAETRRRAQIAAGAEAPPPRPRPRPAPRPASPRPAASADAPKPATASRPAPVARAPVAPVAPAPAAPARGPAPQVEPPETEAPRSQLPVPEAPQPAGEGRPRLRIEALEPGPTPAPALRAGPDAAAAQGAPAASAPPAPAAPGAVAGATGPAGLAAATGPAGLAGAGAAGASPAAPAVLTDAQRLQALEETLAALREEQARNQKLLLQMQVQLAQAQAAQAQAQAERWRNPLVYLLLGLLVLALLGLVLAWRSAQRAREALWWSTGEGGAPPGTARRESLPRQGVLARDEDDVEDDDEDDEFDQDQRRPVSGRTRTARSPLPEDDGDEDDAGTDALRPAALVDPAHARHVNTEELMDVRQKSEFFLSLGQHEQAIAVLREHIDGNAGTSALAYLDLLRVFHHLGRRDDYARLGAEFERAFNARVPAFDAYTDQGRGLDQYPGAMARIAAVWGTAATLPLIEELVFRKPGERGEMFDLPAYQELLMLYGVASEPAAPGSGRVEPVAPSVTPPGWLAESGAADDAKGPAVPSIYGTLDPAMYPDTAPMPHLPTMPHEVAPVPPVTEIPTLDMELADLDRTDFQTLRAPIETPPAPVSAPVPSPDPHLIDFDPFDPEVEDQIQPRKYVIKR